ncbi:MAG: LytR family transcriptional regulator [Glaciihabitans sp.]|nr:LytR family transcriptional regulator [Glaciihabitans sp.]
MTAVSSVSYGSPVRFPDLASPNTMTKRAWWLVGLNILIPGSAQLLAGSRALGRFGVRSTFLLWGIAVVALIVSFFSPPLLVGFATNVVGLTIIQVLLIAYAILWVVLTLDTLRLTRLLRTGPRARPIIAAFAVLAVVACAGTAGYGAMVSGTARGAITALFSGGEVTEPVDGQYNILLLGGDAGPDRMGMRPDSISVVSINAETGATTMIGIPRNFERATFPVDSPLWGPFPDGYSCGDECLINYLYTYGEEHPELYPDAIADGSTPGIEATRDAVSGVTGLVLQYSVVIDMQGFSDLIDSLGGVTIDVPAAINIAPIEATEPYFSLDAGVQHMDGYTALWYARSRYETNDYERMERQRQVQEAIITQFTPSNVLTKFQDIAGAGVQVISTDIPGGMLSRFVGLANKARTQEIVKLELVPDVVDTVYPDYDIIHALVQSTIHPAAAQ